MSNELSILKQQIEENLALGNIAKVESLIYENEHILIHSIDYFIFKSQVYYFNKNYTDAILLLEKAFNYNPYNISINYNLLLNNLAIKNFDKCNEYFFNIFKIQSKIFNRSSSGEFFKTLVNSLLNHFNYLNINENEHLTLIRGFKNQFEKFLDLLEIFDFKNFPTKSLKNQENYIGNIINQKTKNYCTGLYDNGLFSLYNLSFTDVENIRFNSAFEIFEIDYIGKNYNINLDNNCIVPIISNNDLFNINIDINNKLYSLPYIFKNRYNYYNLLGNVNISSDNDIIIGKPLKLTKDSKNKDLVLTIFVDGLSNSVLKNEKIEDIMPNTYKFFKDGVICNQAYATGEWTLPSVASICTGLHTTNHHLFHPSRNDSIPDNVETIFEIYQNNGYNTCFINNDWRITPLYGYLKGVDRYIYQPSVMMDDNNIIKDAINHLETFKNSNQYMFLSFMELHKIGEGENMDIFTQSQMSLEEKSLYLTDSEKSVNQKYSVGKTAAYKYQLKKLDNILSNLYNYLKSNYNLDNCIITLVSDHGQSFLEKNKKIDLNSNRVEVPLMIRCNDLNYGFCDDIIQNTDYLSIITKLSNINIDLENKDSILPKFLGGKGREYSYSESIYPGKTYKACINTLSYTAHFESKNTINEEGMVSLDDYTFYLYDKINNNYIDNCNIEEECINIIYNHMKYLRIY